MKIDFNGIIDLEIPGDDELATVYDKVKATMQKEDTFDLMEEIKERTEKMEAQEGATGTFASWNLIDKITWNVSEAYCMGFAAATRTVFEAIVMTLKEQATEQGGSVEE